MNSFYSTALFILLSFVLTACGGGGGGGSSSLPSADTYSGRSTPATVDASNSAYIARGAADVALRVDELGTRGNPSDYLFFRSESAQSQTVISLLLDASEQLIRNEFNVSGLQARYEETFGCGSGGSIKVTFPNLSSNAQDFPPSGSGVAVLNNCQEYDLELGGILVLDGVMEFSWSGYDGYDFETFSVDFDIVVAMPGSPAEDFRGQVSCTDYGFSCSVSEDFYGTDGIEYRVQDVSVTGSESLGYSISFARVYHEDYGYFDIVATGITYCANGNIQTGNIQVTDSTNTVVVEVDFMSCDEYTVTYDGVSNVYPQ